MESMSQRIETVLEEMEDLLNISVVLLIKCSLSAVYQNLIEFLDFLKIK